MDAREAQIAKSLEVALELIRLQGREIEGLRNALMALRESVASGKPALEFDSALRQVLQDQRGNAYIGDDTASLAKEHLEKLRGMK